MARFVIADDSVVMRAILQYMLENIGHSVAAAAPDGDEAVDRFREIRPDAVILDISMRGRDGVEDMARIKAIDPAALVVLVVDAGQDAEERRATASGAAAILHKPFTLDEVQSVVSRLARP